MELGISVFFNTVNDQLNATIDIPQQGAKNLPLQKVSYKDPAVYFELPAGPGLAIFDGKLNNETIEGSFKQGPATGTFLLNKVKPFREDSTMNYSQKEVLIQNGPVSLAGTLLTPKTEKAVSAVIFVTGSGPQDRDEDIFGFKVFKIIAEFLAEKGIASLRYDDRGVGKSTGDLQNATTVDLASDADAVLGFLKNKSGLNISKTGIIGHSEGAIIAGMIAASKNAPDFIILMAGSAIRGDKLLLEQGQLINKVSGFSQEDAEKQMDMQKEIFSAIRSKSGWDDIEKDLEKGIREKLFAIPVEERRHIADPETYIKNAVAAQMKEMQSPWMAFFIDYNPADDLKKVHIPVLAFFGGKDLQVPAKDNMAAMQEIFKENGNNAFKAQLFTEANHLFQKAKSGSPAEYASLKHEFVDGFLDTLANWIMSLNVQAK